MSGQIVAILSKIKIDNYFLSAYCPVIEISYVYFKKKQN